jgi:subtilisin family serine protease
MPFARQFRLSRPSACRAVILTAMGVMGFFRPSEAARAPVQMRFPAPMSFQVDTPDVAGGGDGVPGHPVDAPEESWVFEDRVVVGEEMFGMLQPVLDLWGLRIVEWPPSGPVVLQAPDAWTSVRAAAAISGMLDAGTAYAVFRRPVEFQFRVSAAPNDEFFAPSFAGVQGQWYLDGRDPGDGTSQGVDINARGAWAVTHGEGVRIAFADTGIELTHPDLKDRVAGVPHHNFVTGADNGSPVTRFGENGAHGTSCAGLAVATADNHLAMSGVAPRASAASWVITDAGGSIASDDKLAQMFVRDLATVDVQNHSWALPGKRLVPTTALDEAALKRVVSEGRGGRGAVMVRAGGNGRAAGRNGNDDAFVSDSRAICVAAVRRDGRPTDYSSPGACILVSAPGGTTADGGLFTTDLPGFDGANFVGFFPPYQYLSDYRFNSLGFVGTSASAPLVAGVVALVVAANPTLTLRDVQQVLLLSARHVGDLDPDVRPNGAGLRVSHNAGYGVVDAGAAVRLAVRWSNRPPSITITQAAAMVSVPVPDDGLKLEVSGDDIPPELASVRTLPGTGPFPDESTAALPVAALPVAGTVDLTGSAALVEYSSGHVVEAIQRAASMGARFVIFYNCTQDGAPPCGTSSGLPLVGTDFTPIPSVFIGRSAGLSLGSLAATNAKARVRLHLNAAIVPFDVGGALSLEHVRLRLQTDHPLRGDLRVTLVSPSGTRSVLQQLNDDTSPGPVDWTYTSARHFYEPSAGTWRLEVSDLSPGATGSVLGASLILNGVPITDSDRDGLDDGWELAFLGTLDHGALDQPAGDGISLVRKFAAGWDPRVSAERFRVEVQPWSDTLMRVSWPSDGGPDIVRWGQDPAQLLDTATVQEPFPEAVRFFPAADAARFFQVRRER